MPDQAQTTAIPSTDPNAGFPMVRLISALFLAWLVSGVLVCGIVAMTGWDTSAAAMGTGATLAGTIAGLVLMNLVPGSGPVAWAWTQIATSSVRMFVALSAGLALTISMSPDKAALWGALLVTGLATLVAEVLVFLPAIRGGSMEARA